MSLSLQDVARIAQLSRISVTETEIEGVRTQLNTILDLIEQMQAVDTTGVEPMAHPQDVFLRLRDDKVTETNHRELYQSVAPQVEKGLFLVPKVIE